MEKKLANWKIHAYNNLTNYHLGGLLDVTLELAETTDNDGIKSARVEWEYNIAKLILWARLCATYPKESAYSVLRLLNEDKTATKYLHDYALLSATSVVSVV